MLLLLAFLFSVSKSEDNISEFREDFFEMNLDFVQREDFLDSFNGNEVMEEETPEEELFNTMSSLLYIGEWAPYNEEVLVTPFVLGMSLLVSNNSNIHFSFAFLPNSRLSISFHLQCSSKLIVFSSAHCFEHLTFKFSSSALAFDLIFGFHWLPSCFSS